MDQRNNPCAPAESQADELPLPSVAQSPIRLRTRTFVSVCCPLVQHEEREQMCVLTMCRNLPEHPDERIEQLAVPWISVRQWRETKEHDTVSDEPSSDKQPQRDEGDQKPERGNDT